MNTEKSIEKAAFVMRSTLESLRGDLVGAGYSFYSSFPEGCCEYSSIFLGCYLVEQGLCQEDEIAMPYNNHHETDCAHGWLLINDSLIVDITADQFDGVDDAVIVTRESEFHSLFYCPEWWSFEEAYKMNSTGSNAIRFEEAWSIIKKFAEPQR